MAIAPKPNGNRRPAALPPTEKAAEAFISGAGRSVEPENASPGMKPTTMRFEMDFLKRIDAVAKRRGLNRTAWIRYVVTRALDEEEA